MFDSSTTSGFTDPTNLARLDILLLHTCTALATNSSLLQICECRAAGVASTSHLLDVCETDGGDEVARLFRTLAVIQVQKEEANGKKKQKECETHLPRLGNLSVKLIDLFEGEAFCLVDAEVDEGDADYTEAGSISYVFGPHDLIRLARPR